MTRTITTEGQALWHPGGAEEDSCFHEGDRHIHQAYKEEEKEDVPIDMAEKLASLG